MASVEVLRCPVCSAPLDRNAERCAYCGSAVVIKTDLPDIDQRSLNRAVIDAKIADYRDEIHKDSKDAKAHYGLGVAYFSLGLPEDAATELRHAAKLAPENATFQAALAVVLEKLVGAKPRLWHDAMDRANRALALDPRLEEALRVKVELLERRGNRDEALAIWRQIAQLDPKKGSPRLAAALRVAAQDNLQAGNADAAIANLTELRALDPESLNAAVSAFLAANAPLLAGFQFPVTRPRGSLRAHMIIGCLAMIGLAVFFSAIAPKDNGEIAGNDPRSVFAIAALYGIFLVPAAILVVTKVNAAFPGRVGGQRSRWKIDDVVTQTDVPVAVLMQATRAALYKRAHPGAARSDVDRAALIGGSTV
jgi:tetratricopeptide (TPR) repeat protein